MSEQLELFPRDDYPTVTLQNIIPSPIIFLVTDNKGAEMIRMMTNGNIYVHGKFTTNDEEVVDGFRAFLKSQGFIR